MPGNVVIAGFSPTDKVPGAYGEVVYGAGGQSAAAIPLLLLLCGLSAGTGNLNQDTEVRQVYSLSDIDTAAGAGAELATMGYDALATAPGTPMYLLAPKPAGGATAAAAYLTIAGTPTGTGTITVRCAGVPISTQISTTDTATTIATNVAAAINGALVGRLPLSATSSAGIVTVTDKTAGVRGMQHVVFLDSSQLAPGITAVWYGAWAATTAFTSSPVQLVIPSPANGYYYKCTTAGTTGGSQPVWPTTVGTTVSDGTVTWTCWGTTVTSGAAQVGITLGNSTGTETYTNSLSTISSSQFDRIGLAANDSVSLGAWSTQITSVAGPTTGILQHAIFGFNGTLAAAETLTTTTLNAQRFQCVWELNSETHPPRIAGAVAALATVTEQADPAASYDGVPLPTVRAQSQKPDWPVHGTLVGALNNGVTPLFTYGDGLARIVRSITTHCLLSSNPDYSTLDTSAARCPDYVLKDLKLYYTTVFQPANARAQDDPAGLTSGGATGGPSARLPPSGVAYPALWSSSVTQRLRDMEAGKNPGTCPPIIINVSGNLPTSNWDPVAKRIMSAIPIQVAPGNHQVGISIRQVA